jgi:hypothetical protein
VSKLAPVMHKVIKLQDGYMSYHQFQFSTQINQRIYLRLNKKNHFSFSLNSQPPTTHSLAPPPPPPPPAKVPHFTKPMQVKKQQQYNNHILLSQTRTIFLFVFK